MEIDVKKEQERIQDEVKELVNQANEIDGKVSTLQQQHQEILKQILKKQGELELLQRLEKEK